jgi:hypothetical protein
MPGRFSTVGLRLALAVIVFVVLAVAIYSRPAKRMVDFDQAFYLTVAYDLERHGVFSNGVFDKVDSTQAEPPPGMFFGPLYPWLIRTAMALDSRFATAVHCTIEANERGRGLSRCDIYAGPILLIHVLLLTIGVLAVARSGEAIVGGLPAYATSGILATAGVAVEADLLSFIMTESLWFCLASVLMLTVILGLTREHWGYFAVAGLLLGALSLTKASFLILAPVLLILMAIHARWFSSGRGRFARNAAAFVAVFALVLTPWLTRNYAAFGRIAFSEEYGSLSLIERFAYNDMTAKEFALAFPYCVPVVGPAIVNGLFGPDATARFEWSHAGGFFKTGRAHREALVAAHGRVDPIMGGLLRTELQQNGWRHLASSIPLAWCGLWVSGLWSVLMLPLFLIGCVAAVRRGKPLLLFYAAPAIVLVGLHAAVANHYSRYNLGLIGPFSVGAACLISAMAPRRWRSCAPAP